jgi:hypothetical protein
MNGSLLPAFTKKSAVMQKTILFFTLFLTLTVSLVAGTYYVSPQGSDASGNGSDEKPWESVAKAIESVPDDGSTIIVKDGLYVGFFSWKRAFEKTCTIQAEHPYQARFTGRHDRNMTFWITELSNVVISGIEVFGNGSKKGNYLMQITTAKTHDLTFKDCIIHDSYNNDLIKLNSLAHHVTFTGCVFFNPNNHGGDEHFDINTAHDITIEDSIFFNDYEGSERPEENSCHSWIIIKNSEFEKNPAVTKNVTLRRNIFLNWSGLPDQAYILLGEESRPFFEAQNILFENNLFLHNTPPRIIGTFMFKGGVKNVTARANTITGKPNSVGFSAFAAVFWKLGENPPQENVLFANNIFCNNTGSITRFSAGGKEIFADHGFKAVNNVYWNGGVRIAAEPTDIFVPAIDPKAILTSPRLKAVPKKLPLPRFDFNEDAFLSGNKTIRQEFEYLVKEYAVPKPGGSGIGKADLSNMPDDDILGHPRSKTVPDAGCYETEK